MFFKRPFYWLILFLVFISFLFFLIFFGEGTKEETRGGGEEGFLWYYWSYAPINVKPLGGRLGKGGGFDSSHRPVVGTFDCFNGLSNNIHLILKWLPF